MTEIVSFRNKSKIIKIKKIILIAAIIAVLFSIAVPVCAKFVSKQANDNIVK